MPIPNLPEPLFVPTSWSDQTHKWFKVYFASPLDIVQFIRAQGGDPAKAEITSECDCARGDWVEPERHIEISWKIDGS